MVKPILKLAIVALIAHAGFRVGSEYLTYIKFRDGVRDAAMFRAKNDEELVNEILGLAGQFDLPVSEAALSIRRAERQVRIDGSYDKPIEVVPSYFYPWHFEWSIQATVSPFVSPYAPRR